MFAAKRTLAIVLLAFSLALGLTAVFLVSRQNLALADSRRQANTDDLTGLCNRRGFYPAAEAAIAAAARADDASVALLLLDLDSFKGFNDTLGHHAGDEVLCHFAERLQTALPDAQLVARLGGDGFVALLGPGAGADEAMAAATRLFAALEEPVPLEGLMAHVSVSVGIATTQAHGTTRTELLRDADLAMYRAKQQGTGIEIYEAADDHNAPDRLHLAGDLRAALKRDELVVHYQPKGDLVTGTIVGVEALVRWQHPVRGLLAPDTFLPLAERYGLMREVTHVVLERALDQHRAWRRRGLVLPVAVNVSPVNLLDARFPDEVVALLEAAALPPEALQLEITENTIMTDPARALDVLARLSEHGISLALDDFGTGHSSLAHLRGLPVQELKIDRSFVRDMTTSGEDRAIVRSTIDLVRDLGLRVVAEGVETAEHWDQLRHFGCHAAQGFYLSRPLPADELTGWLSTRPGQQRAAPDVLRPA